jgi:hypothetical protein
VKFSDIDQTGWLIIGGVAVILLYEYASNSNAGGNNPLQNALGIPDPTDTTGNPNSIGDTSSAAYAGSGVFGWLGNLFNKASGGLLQSAGQSIGSGISNLTCSYTANPPTC